MKKQYSTLERNLQAPRPESNLSTFCLLFSGYEQLLKRKYEQDYGTIQKRLEELGKNVGTRLYELICLRERRKRENKIIDQLQFVRQSFWKQVFGKVPEGIEKSREGKNNYFIRDESPLLLRYCAESRISAASFMVGILQGVFESSGFKVEISYQFNQDEKEQSLYPYTIFIFSFEEQNLIKI